MLKIKRAFRKFKLFLIYPAQILPRKYYIKFIESCYADSVVFDKEPPRFIAADVYFDKSNKIYIGGGSTITAQTIILTHDYSVDYGLMAVHKNNPQHEQKYCKEVHIGNHTFIGQRSLILPGITIGNNVIIGAGSLVNRDIPDNVVAAGVPAKVICPIEEWIEKRMKRDAEYIV